MKLEGYLEAKDFSEVQTLPPGPQCCKITAVRDIVDKSYLEIEFDIVKGDYEGYFASLAERVGKWSNAGTFRRSYKPTAMGFFKSTIVAIEKSNKGYDFVATNYDEKTLVGKYVVVNFGEEEYVKDGQIAVSVRPVEFRSVDALKEGKIKVPEIKRLPENERPVAPTATTAELMGDDFLPF